MKFFTNAVSLIILICILTQETYGQGGWVLQLSGNVPSDSPRKLFFINNNTGWMSVSDKIYKTTNSGIGWWRQFTDTTRQFTDIFFINENTGYLTRYNGSVWKSTNGGVNWAIKVSTTATFTNIFFANSASGWCTGRSGVIYCTTDSGETWVPQTSGTLDDLNAIYFISPETGWVAGNWGTIKYTSNGGVNWLTQSSNTVSFLNSIYFATNLKGWACGSGGRILMTTNGGINWIFAPTITNNNLNSIHFVSEAEGWAFGDLGTFLKSTDGGATWSQQNNGINLKIFNSAFPGGGYIFLSAESGNIIRSTDSGISWNIIFREILITAVLQSIYFSNDLTGWSVGRSGTIVKTINGGFTWELQDTITVKNFNSVFFTSENEGYIAGGRLPPTGPNASLDTTIVLKTTNSGTNWNIQFIDTIGSLNSVYFINPSYGWAVGRKGILLKTTNGGLNWSKSIIAANINSQKVFFTSVNDGWVAYGATSLYKTTNGGLNWVIQPIGVSSNYNSVFFYNSMIGWTGATDGRVCRTVNGGINWSCVLIDLPFVSFNSLFFVTSDLGWFIGRYIVKTTNGGLNWIQEYSPVGNMLYSVFFTPEGNGWACGANANIIHKTEIIGINIISTEVPDDYFLYQNYPNPFNPVTKIRFKIAGAEKNSNVSLVIYDALGREVTTLVNEKLIPGTYEVEWNARNFASGVYFYELKTGRFTQTKKLVLIK